MESAEGAGIAMRAVVGVVEEDPVGGRVERADELVESADEKIEAADVETVAAAVAMVVFEATIEDLGVVTVVAR